MFNVIGLIAGLFGAILLAYAQYDLFRTIKLWLDSLTANDLSISNGLQNQTANVPIIVGADKHYDRSVARSGMLSTGGWVLIALGFAFQVFHTFIQ